jgi:hypothetical protein
MKVANFWQIYILLKEKENKSLSRMTFDDCSICSLFYGFADKTANFVDVFMTIRPLQFDQEMFVPIASD